MAQNLKLRELGMDTMERLYYERQDERKRAYVARKRKKPAIKKRRSTKRLQMKHDSDAFDRTFKKTLCDYNMC